MGGESVEEPQETLHEEVQVESSNSFDVDGLINKLVDKFGKRYKDQIQNNLYMLSLDNDIELQKTYFDKFESILSNETAEESDLATLLASLAASM